MAKKRTTVVTREILVSLKPRQYLRYLVKVNRDIDKIDIERTIERTFDVAVIGDKLCKTHEYEDIAQCKDGTMFM